MVLFLPYSVMVPLTIIPSDPLAKSVHLVPRILCSVDLEGGLSSKGRAASSMRHNHDFQLNWKLRLPPNYFGLLMSLNRQAKEGVSVLAGGSNPDYQGEIGLLRSGGKQEYVWNTEILKGVT